RSDDRLVDSRRASASRVRQAAHQPAVPQRRTSLPTPQEAPMRWSGRRQSTNVEDRRGMPVAGIAGGGILAVVAILYALFTGQDPTRLLEQLPTAGADDQARG